MGFAELFLISVGLAMDAFSVSVCKGLSMKQINRRGALMTALFFGVFQGGMPIIGYFLGSRFMSEIEAFDHWVSFGLLAIIGGKMVFEAITEKEDEASGDYRLDYRELFILAVATSIDALAVGLVFAASDVNLLFSASVIGLVTFVLSLCGVLIGHRFGSRYEKKAETAGGIILILIGLKLLLEGLGVI